MPRRRGSVVVVPVDDVGQPRCRVQDGKPTTHRDTIKSELCLVAANRRANEA